jgi:2-keto-4-pentenoate hydratase
MLSPDEIDSIAADLFAQHLERRPFTPFPDRIPSMEDANDVQDALIALMAARERSQVDGYKVALTSKSTRDWLKIHEPCAGQILGSRIHRSPHTASLADYVRFSIETEICVVLDRDLQGDFTATQVRDAVRSVHCSYELVEDRAADLTRLDARSLVSDNSWNGGIVIGPAAPAGLDLTNRAGRLRVNGEITKEGTTRDTMGGDPFFVVAWLVGHLGRRGRALKAGQPVITGSIIETQFPAAGDVLSFEVDGMPPVELRVAPWIGRV